MIRAYPETYLNKAQGLLGDAFDYAVNVCCIPGTDFAELFAASSISRRMANGEPAILVGKSGPELVRDVMADTAGGPVDVPVPERLGRSREYWIGWAVGYYQWFSARPYAEIFQALPFDDLVALYDTLHEADVTKFADVAERRVRIVFAQTNLQRIRTSYGCTQAELAEASGVGLRSIQMYEQRNKDINKAAALTVYRIAKALGCTVEDLLER